MTICLFADDPFRYEPTGMLVIKTGMSPFVPGRWNVYINLLWAIRINISGGGR